MLYKKRKNKFERNYSRVKDSLNSTILKDQDHIDSHPPHWKRPRELDIRKLDQENLEEIRIDQIQNEKFSREKQAKDKIIERFWKTKLRKFSKRKAKINLIIKKNEHIYKYRNYVKLAKGIDLHDNDENKDKFNYF